MLILMIQQSLSFPLFPVFDITQALLNYQKYLFFVHLLGYVSLHASFVPNILINSYIRIR